MKTAILTIALLCFSSAALADGRCAALRQLASMAHLFSASDQAMGRQYYAQHCQHMQLRFQRKKRPSK